MQQPRWLQSLRKLMLVKSTKRSYPGDKSCLGINGICFQHHIIQRRKAILQHLNPQLKGLVKDEDFTTAAPFLFGPDFGEIAKRRLEAAALIQKTQAKP